MTARFEEKCILGYFDQAAFERVMEAYNRVSEADVCVVDLQGKIVLGGTPCDNCLDEACRQAWLDAIKDTLRWGEVTASFCPGERLIWGVPVMLNERQLGGLVGRLPESEAFEKGEEGKLRDFRELCQALRVLVEQENLTNASLLATRRLRYTGEQERAHAIHAFKRGKHNSLRQLYLREESALFAAIRGGERRRAREILNRILVALHHHAGQRLDLLKSIFLELVVVMSRTAVEAGGNPEELLGRNFNMMAALSGLTTVDEVGQWLVRALEHLMDAIERARQEDAGALVSTALAYIEKNCGKNIQRDDVASVAGVSPSHFSFLIRQETGETFTDLLNHARVSRSAVLLRTTDAPLSQIALSCGFNDQSYFTKVFKKYRQTTPLKYRSQRK